MTEVARDVAAGVGSLAILVGTLLSVAPASSQAYAGTPATDTSLRLCHGYAGLPEGGGPHAGMAWLPGGTFTMGDDGERPEERPARRVTVSGFWIDRTEVTTAQFARFAAATGYETVA